MPLAIAEAMAMGLPVVSTRVVGIPELVRAGVGLLVSPHGPVELAQALEQVYRAGDQGRAEMGQHGRVVVEQHFNIQNEVRKMWELFQDVRVSSSDSQGAKRRNP